MKRVLVLLLGSGLGTVGGGLLAAGYGAAGVLLVVLGCACGVVALTVRWRLEDGDQSLPTTGRIPPA